MHFINKQIPLHRVHRGSDLGYVTKVAEAASRGKRHNIGDFHGGGEPASLFLASRRHGWG